MLRAFGTVVQMKLLNLSLSRTYYVHEAKYDASGVGLNDADGKPTGVKLANCDWCDAAIEGTVRTTDKNGKAVTLNYAKTSSTQQCDCNLTCPKYAKYANKKIGYTLWAPAKGEFGDGVGGYKLVPFRTIAVDKKFIPIGSLIFIPQAVGVEITLPDGSKSKHDGYFFAADVGGDIKAKSYPRLLWPEGQKSLRFRNIKARGDVRRVFGQWKCHRDRDRESAQIMLCCDRISAIGSLDPNPRIMYFWL